MLKSDVLKLVKHIRAYEPDIRLGIGDRFANIDDVKGENESFVVDKWLEVLGEGDVEFLIKCVDDYYLKRVNDAYNKCGGTGLKKLQPMSLGLLYHYLQMKQYLDF